MNTQRTYTTKKEDIKRQWYVIDAKDKVLGRVAAKAATLLRGKHRVYFTPHLDCGDFVVIINASKVRVTGRKAAQKEYRRFSGYPGGLRIVSYADMLARKPETVLRLAVERMIPGGPLGRDVIKKLKVYAGEAHPHAAQKPVEYRIAE